MKKRCCYTGRHIRTGRTKKNENNFGENKNIVIFAETKPIAMTQAKMLEVSRPHFVRPFNVNETLQLLNRYGFRFWSWGAEKFKNLNNQGLFFKVNGHHHKGYVLITLNGGDLYDVRLINTSGVIKDTITDLFFDQLFDAIDEKVEKIPEYTR